METVIIFKLPIRLKSEANCSEHWALKSRRHRAQQLLTRLAYKRSVDAVNFPCEIRLTRCSAREFDDDNLQTAFKYIRDELSECIFPEKAISKTGKKIKGRADSDKRLVWRYDQQKSKEAYVKIEISYPTTVKSSSEDS